MQALITISLLRKISYLAWLTVTMLVLLLIYVPMVNAETATEPATQSITQSITEPMVVYKSPTCGCCGAWVDHMSQAGFSSTVQHPKDLNAIKQTLGVAPAYQACHTSTLQNYVFEGHIPADVIQHFLVNTPNNAIGLAVPGMPMGSPGMDTGRAFRAYEVLQLNKDGSSSHYATVSAGETLYAEKGL
ncbi:CopG protein [gamma proteobacterium IMCC1989]|nr:CopG protein [gamma proteobacterium IMCC1989]